MSKQINKLTKTWIRLKCYYIQSWLLSSPPGHIWAGPKSLPLGSEVTLYCQKPQAKIFWGNTKLAKWSLLLPIVLLDILFINFTRCNSHKGTVNGDTLFTCYGKHCFLSCGHRGLGSQVKLFWTTALLLQECLRVSLSGLYRSSSRSCSPPPPTRESVHVATVNQRGNLILLSPAWWGLFSPQFCIKDAMGGHWYI